MFIAIPVGMNYRTERLPLVTLSLIGLNTLVYLVGLICLFATQGDSQVWIMEHLWLVPSMVFSQPWTLFTHMFIHEGFFHLAGNMIFLFLFGSCVEDMIGRMRFALFYLLGGLIAGLAYICMIPEHFSSEIPMGGASGAIMSCMGMYLMLRASVEIEFKYFFWFFLFYMRAGEFEIPAWVAIGIYFTLDLIGAIFGMLSPDPHHGGTAFGAHVGGFLSGVAMMAIYKAMKKHGPEEEPAPVPVTQPARTYARAIIPEPIRETPTIYLHDGINQSGPFTLTEIQGKLTRGEISLDAQYWSEGMAEWQWVKDLAAYPAE